MPDIFKRLDGRVLLADDDEDVRQFLSFLIQTETGVLVDTAADGTKAFEMYRSGRYDLIITDFNMPGMTGIELMRRIRENGNHVPVVLATGHHEDISWQDEGFAGCMRKPYGVEELMKYLQTYCSG